MKNKIEIELPLVNNELLDIFDGSPTGKEIIHKFITDDFGAPPKWADVKIKTKSNKIVTITIPYDDSSDIRIFVDREEI